MELQNFSLSLSFCPISSFANQKYIYLFNLVIFVTFILRFTKAAFCVIFSYSCEDNVLPKNNTEVTHTFLKYISNNDLRSTEKYHI